MQESEVRVLDPCHCHCTRQHYESLELFHCLGTKCFSARLRGGFYTHIACGTGKLANESSEDVAVLRMLPPYP